jgi:2-hydroxy-3-keto-5-methylthiopentenyl-1-phosphate phosphatase
MKENSLKATVHIVHHVDTEGPLYESIEETFKRIIEITGKDISINPTKENLKKIQRGEIDFWSIEDIEKVKIITAPHLLNYKDSWYEVDEMLYRILSDEFRKKFQDSYGNSWIFNWHIMDHVGFETNPRHRDLGYLNIYDHYVDILSQTQSLEKDAIQWHFHPVHHTKRANFYATSYENCYTELHQILSRRLIDRNWFPIVNRAGFHTERPDSNWFLEQWMPFDASNQAIENDDYCSNGRFGDWKGAPNDWSIYHPDIYDWRKTGNCNRYISRVLNLKTRFRNITIEEIRKAFYKAQTEQSNIYLGITDHDFREISIEIEGFYQMLLQVSREFPEVKFCFSKAIDAFRSVLNINKEQENELILDSTIQGSVVSIYVKQGEPFGPQPYLAIKTKNGDYIHDNLDFGEFKKEYFYTLDIHTVPLEKVEEMKVASNDKFGNQCIIKII